MKLKREGVASAADSRGFWTTSHDYICVMLQGLETEARVGLHPWEQHAERPSRLIVNIEMFARTAGQFDATHTRPMIDYDPVRQALKAWPARPHTLLLETLVEEVVKLCFGIAAVEACRVSILKPDIFNDAAAAGIEVYRRRPGSS